MIYRIAGNFDGGNIHGFDAQLAIRQNFPFQYFHCIANTGCLRPIRQYFPRQTSE